MKPDSIRVGVPQQFDPSFARFFPANVEIVCVPDQPDTPLDIEFWIPSYMLRTVAQALPYLRGVKVVQALLAGVDAISGSIPPGAILCDGQGIHDVPVAEWVVGAILSSLKYLQFYEAVRLSKQWKSRFGVQDAFLQLHPGTPPPLLPILSEELAGSEVLIVGYGSIGAAIERRLQPFEVTITRVSRRRREGISPVSDVDSLLPRADIVILLVPLTADTTHMFNASRIGKMKQGALLVNAARGPVVDTDALVSALQAHRIRAALDVTDPEPLPTGHPLWNAPNLLLTPHVGGGGPRFLERAFKLAGEQVERYVQGQPLINVVSDGY